MNRKERRVAAKQGRPIPGGAIPQAEPPEIALLLDEASLYHEAGRFAEAERVYRQILVIKPNHAHCLYRLGVLAQQIGRTDAAIDLIGRAIAVNGAVPEFHNDLGGLLQLQGRFERAARSYRRALTLAPGFVEAKHNLGKVQFLRGERDDAIAHFRQIVTALPDYAEARDSLAMALLDSGDHEAAAEHYRQAAALRPESAQALFNLAVALHAQAKLDDAIEQYRRALALRPDYPEALNNLGNAFLARRDHAEAMQCYRQALALRPQGPEAYCNLGFALNELGNASEAIGYCQEALRLRPDFAEAHNNLGNALFTCGQEEEAIAHYRQAIAVRPELAEPHYSLANALNGHGRITEAIAAVQRFLELRPEFVGAQAQLAYLRMRACDWRFYQDEEDALLALVRQGIADVAPFMLLSRAGATAADQLACARLAGARLAHIRPAYSHLPSNEDRHIRLGYLSQDYNEHAMAHLMAELIERHDRSAFEVIGYSYGRDDGSDIRRRLLAAFDSCIEIGGTGDEVAAQRIHADGIDVLVDLNGLTGRPRTGILARRPAPIQVNYLGYPGTMGLDAVDYIVVDHSVVPSDRQPFFTEQLVQLPHCYQPNDTAREIAPVPSRAECGLPETGFVFCCFNNSYKLNPATFDIWMRLLRAVPESCLWLLGGDAVIETNLWREAAARGVEPVRLVFAPRLHLPEHLARHRVADLFLDTFPYNAHSTANDALWAGLPLLTIEGTTFPSRVAASLLRAVELPELITGSPAEYEALALQLAQAPERLARLREHLIGRRAQLPLFDMACYTASLEAAYRQMWQRWRDGTPPAPISITAA